MKELEGKIALVTGASRGIGKGIALVLAEKGAEVVVNFHHRAVEADAVVDEIRAAGGRAFAVQGDVSERDDVKRLFDEVAARCGRLDILVNNAGTSRSQDIFETSEEDWDFIINTNLKSLFLCTRRGMEMMRVNRFGRIINLASMVAHRGAINGHCHYAATKGGILSFTRTVARTGAPYNITCNAIAPGFIETDMTAVLPDDVKSQFIASIPAGRAGTPQDVAGVVAFLVSDDAAYLQGQVIAVDGGVTMQ